MTQRTSIVLDQQSLEAAHQLASHYRVSTSEAIRRAVVAHRDQIRGLQPNVRSEKRRLFESMIQAFEGHDPAEEVQRLKEEDQGF